MRGSDLSPQTPGRWSKSAALSAVMTKSHEIINTTCATEDAGNGWLFISSISAKTPPVLVFHLSNFGRDTFELDIELVDNRLLLR
jgi:hypothetical protein